MTTLMGEMFYNCSSLRNIMIPENITQICDSAFGNCTSLRKIRISKNVTDIDATAFYYCSNLETVEIDKENENFVYEDGIVLNKEKTKMICILPIAINGNEFTIPSTITELNNSNLSAYKQITKLNLPASLSLIDTNVFLFMNVTNITINSENKTYMATDEAIYSKDKSAIVYYFARKENVILEEGITQIENNCFITNTVMKKITLPNTLKSIGAQAFWKCENLQELNINENITNLDPLFAYQVDNLKVTIDEKNPNYTIENNVIFNKDKTKLITLIGNPEEFTVPNSIKEIGDNAFTAKGLKKIIIPEGVSKIGTSFQYCYNLEKIEFPSSVKEISDICFNDSNNLSEIIINNKKGTIAGEPWGCSYGEKAIKYIY